jgi:hypothetical protein
MMLLPRKLSQITKMYCFTKMVKYTHKVRSHFYTMCWWGERWQMCPGISVSSVFFSFSYTNQNALRHAPSPPKTAWYHPPPHTPSVLVLNFTCVVDICISIFISFSTCLVGGGACTQRARGGAPKSPQPVLLHR